jgi:hypothetical protein
MSLFPWESATQASQSFATSRRISSGPMAGRYEMNRPYNKSHEPYQKTPQPPKPVRGLLDGGHPKGKREWEQYVERTVPTNLPPRDTGLEPILAQPLSSAHSRLLPAGRSVSLQIHDDPKKSQRMNVPRRRDQGKKLLRPDPKAHAPALLTRLDGRGDFGNYKQNPKTYVSKPHYDPVLHKFTQDKQPFFDKGKEIRKYGAKRPDRLGEKHDIVPVFSTQVRVRDNQQIVPDAARGISTYGHLRHEDSKFLDFNEFHCKGSFLNSKAYSHSRHFNLGGQGTSSCAMCYCMCFFIIQCVFVL